eukprot:CAMPEP_0172664896 /NCGR_PEP_ID=MMETSP1074-20121228/6901_1 /TAXON_ID=2916 /ORGANISM="Ceratium fusus, Strain PA161109" /LENGTH=127 /DNA_ID=CAMNT_0013481127 /DNA_START=48 /DNA_END=431 /DNA_ORIENTATION=-
MAVVGLEQMAAMPVAERANFKIFQQLSMGTPVRVGGRITGPGALTTTDGGSVSLSGLEVAQSENFTEVVGTKSGDAALAVAGVVQLPAGEVDVELWDEAVKMSHMPQLRPLFAPNHSDGLNTARAGS